MPNELPKTPRKLHNTGADETQTSAHLARLAYREAHARWTGDMVAANEAAAALDAATLRVDAEQWATVYRQVLVDNRHE